VPFKALDGVIDALTHHLLLLTPEERSSLLPQGLPALTRMFPVLGRVVPQDTTTLDVQALRRRGLQALVTLLEVLGQRHVVVVHLDDLQWSDVDGAVLLGELLVGMTRRRARCLILLGYRSEHEARSAGLTALESALRGGGLDDRSLDVGGLTPADAERLAAHLLPGGAQEQLRWIAGASEGLPWLIHELARSVRAGVVQVGASAAGVLERRAAVLPLEARQILELVAVAGQPLRLSQVREALALESLPEGPLRTLRAGSWLRGSGPRLEDTVESFHDRVREGIAAAIPAARRREIHRALARALAADEAPEVIAEHHEAAGEIGAAAALYERAADEARAVLALARAERLYALAERLSTGQDRVRVVEKQIHYLTDVARFSEAYALGRRVLEELGVSLPERASPPLLLAGLARILWSLRDRAPSSLLALPIMTDPQARSAVRMMAACMKAAYQLQPELCVMVANESVELCLRRGNSEDAALGYMVHGTIFRGGVLGRHRTGHAFGRLARALVERHQNERQLAEVLFVVGYFGTSWVEPAVAAEALWDQAFQAGLRSGDLFHTGCAACGTVASLWMRGAPLPEILQRAATFLAALEPRGLDEAVATVRGVQRAAEVLSRSGGPDLQGDGFDRNAHEERLRSFGSRHFAHIWYVVRATVALVRGDPTEALVALRQGAPLAPASRGMLHGAEHSYLEALALSFQADALSWPARARVAAVAARWASLARGCGENFGAKAALLAAEARRGLPGASSRDYEEAIRLARRHGMPHVEGLALRRAGREQEARGAFERWGAFVLACLQPEAHGRASVEGDKLVVPDARDGADAKPPRTLERHLRRLGPGLTPDRLGRQAPDLPPCLDQQGPVVEEPLAALQVPLPEARHGGHPARQRIEEQQTILRQVVHHGAAVSIKGDVGTGHEGVAGKGELDRGEIHREGLRR
jgi:tetratricopeptide (TPR) repeat protein